METKYKKYKTKYLNLKQYNNFIKEHKFYITHRIMKFNNLLKVLKEGILKRGIDVPTSVHHMENIYGNIYFNDLRNIEYPSEYMLLLHPKIFLNYDIKIDKGWGVGNIVEIKKNDISIKEKLETAYDFIKNPVGLLGTLDELTKGVGIMKHQIVIDGTIDLKEYLLGVICLEGQKRERKIKKELDQKYPNVTFITENKFPTFDDIICKKF